MLEEPGKRVAELLLRESAGVTDGNSAVVTLKEVLDLDFGMSELTHFFMENIRNILYSDLLLNGLFLAIRGT